LGPEAPVNFGFGGGASSTLLHPLMLVAMIIALIVIFVAPRKYISIPFLLVIFLGSLGQQIYVGGLHFYILRILIMAGLVRLVFAKFTSSGGLFTGGFDWVDKLFVMWICFRCAAGVLLNDAASGAVNYQLSYLLDALGGYLFLRYLIRDEEDIVRVVKVFAALTFIFALTMANEKFRNQNIFGYLGAVPIVPTVREGSIRAQAAFAHPILAGAFGVALIPLFWWLWISGKAKVAGAFGFCGSLGMMLTSASSTPLMAFLAAIAGWAAWSIRSKMRVVRWGFVVLLIALHLVMKAPVWFLIARADLIAGSSGYHRAMLIDLCVRHFADWWLIGTNAAGSWDWDMWDTSNQFVQEAESGGLLTFICFVMIIARSFNKLGKARQIIQNDVQQQKFMWFLAVALLTNCVLFFGVSYFDHTKIMWFALLAIIAAATAPILATQKETVPALEHYPIPLKRPLPAPKLARIGDPSAPVSSMPVGGRSRLR
jgi:hypothetical protein